MAPNPSDLERPVPNEPVRIQPPVPEFARGSRPNDRDERPSDRDDGREPRHVDDAVRAQEMARERRQLQNDPDRRRANERSSYDVNRWVHQRANQPRGGRWQMHGTTTRGR